MRQGAPFVLILLLCLLGGGLWLVLDEPGSGALPGQAPGHALLEEGDSVGLAPERTGETRLAPAAGASPVEAPPAEPVPGGSGEGSVQVQAVPEDPVERGLAALALSVLEEETGAPLAGTVILWRLDAPASAYWQAGDRKQGAIRIVRGEGEITALPEGRYRAVFEEQRAAVEDPPLFEVRGRTRVTLRVPMPRRFQASLRLLDERGLPIVGVLAAWPHRGAEKLSSSPVWVRARTLKHAPTAAPSPVPPQDSPIEDHSWRPLGARGDLLPLGELEEASRGSRTGRTVAVRAEGRSEARLTPFSAPAASVTYLAVALPLATLLDRFTLPDGGPVLGSRAGVTATCQAEALTAETPAERWRSIPVRIVVTLRGYEPLEATADVDHPSPLPPPWKRIEPKAPTAQR